MKEKIAFISVLANIALAGGKLLAGAIAGSGAVFAEGLHSGVDVISSVISLVGIKIAKKPVDKEHPYGHYKYEVMAGFIITIILFLTALFIIIESTQELLNPSPVDVSYLTLGVMLISAAINQIMSSFKIKVGKEENSVSLLSDGIHSKVDVYASLAVFSGLFLTRYWEYFDPLMAFLIGLYIIKESLSLGKEASDSLLDVSAGDKVEEKIRTLAKEENIEISDLKTQKKGSAVTANIEINLPNNLTVSEVSKISENLRIKLTNEISNLTYISIQINSHEIETGYYKPTFGRGFGWQKQGKGPGGSCVCPKCGYKTEHQRGVPCASKLCPSCKVKLERDYYAKTKN